MFVNPTEGRVLNNQTQVSNRKEFGVPGDSDSSSEPPEERLTIDNLNLQCFISLSESWNAIDTLFVFIIVLISHPAGVPLPAGLWAAQQDLTTQLKQSLDFMARLISFIYINNFFFFLLLSLIFTNFFSCLPLMFVRGQEQKAWAPKMALLLKTPRIMEKPLLWIFISSSHLSEENSTDVLVPCPPPWLYLERLRWNWCQFLNFGGRRGGEPLQKGCSVVPGVVCSVWPHPSFVDGNLEDRLWCRSDTISICGSCFGLGCLDFGKFLHC